MVDWHHDRHAIPNLGPGPAVVVIVVVAVAVVVVAVGCMTLWWSGGGFGDRTAGEIEEDAANAPLEANELRGLVDFSLGEDVNPLALLQQADRFVNCRLEDAVATDDGDDLATLEEGANGSGWRWREVESRW